MIDLHTIRVPEIETASALGTIVCGVDGSAEAAEAVRQAGLLAAPGGCIELVGVIHAGLVESVAAVMPARAAEPEQRLRQAAWEALGRVSLILPAGLEVRTTLRTGPAAKLLEIEAARIEADLIAVGSHGQGRLTGKLLGGVATHLVHDAARAVLIARGGPGTAFPRSIVVGVDESEPSLRALALARELCRRTGAELDPMHVLDSSPATALVERAGADDLLVVGSRGVRGLRSLGSVSETVAHRAPCSVLVVR
ncbi:MAG TPA: universal stress protein [Gaiellales bacterium]|jgi:nucleotide-binding universal stress UspA family protein